MLRFAGKVITINILILCSGVFLLEAIFGSWFGPSHLNRLNLIKNATILYDARGLYPASGFVSYTRDPYGFRGQYRSLSLIDILTVGGSTTDQRYLPEEATWQDILRKDFEASGKPVSVVNAGVDGQSTYGHIKNFEWWFPHVPGLKVKYFLFYVGMNDLQNILTRNTYVVQYDDLTGTASPLKTAIREKSAIYHLYRTLRGIYRSKVAQQTGHGRVKFRTLVWTDMPRLHNHSDIMRGSLFVYGERLRMLVEKTRALNAIPIFVTQPSRRHKRVGARMVGVANTTRFEDREINGMDDYFMMQLINTKTMEVCHKAGGIGIDLSNELEFEDDDFYDFQHNTPKGAEKIGHYLYSRLKSCF